MKDCIFCKIVKGEAKSWTVYEDKDVKAFFAINPATLGHTLVIPKKHYEDIYSLPEEELKKIISVIKKLTLLYKEKLGITECNILHASGKNAQQSVPHFHMHIVPRHKNDGLNMWFKEQPQLSVKFEELLEKLK